MDILEYIHENEYVHADIKAANLMLGYRDPEQVSPLQIPGTVTGENKTRWFSLNCIDLKYNPKQHLSFIKVIKKM